MTGSKPNRGPSPDDGPPQEPELADLLDELETLEETVDDPDEREQVRATLRTARRVQPAAFGRVIRGFDRHDAAEALVGSVVFGVPMLVEDGTLAIGAFLAAHPASFVATLVGTVGVVVGVLYVAEIQRVEIYRPYLGVVPRRLAGVLVISYVAALVLMTGWGRVSWTDPWLALCQSTVVFAPMALGAALGDILPGS